MGMHRGRVSQWHMFSSRAGIYSGVCFTPPMDREREGAAVEEATMGCMLRSGVAVATLGLAVVCGNGRENGRF